ncbi:MAG: VOC family protein [Spirochaetales bacterium]|nr:VOC family protein [Spirochaetales bacterium]
MNAEIDHIAIKVSDIETFASGLTAMGCTLDSVKQHDEVGMKIAFISGGDKGRMELLQVTDPDSPIAGCPDGLHHIALGVDDIEASHKMMSESPLYSVEGNVRQGAHSRIFFYRIIGQEHTLYECTEKSTGVKH